MSYKQSVSPAPASCSLCGRTPPDASSLEKHHLTPRARKGKETVTVCIDCGDQVHKLFSLKELSNDYATLSALRSDERVQRWVRWIRRQKRFGVCMKRKKRKGR